MVAQWKLLEKIGLPEFYGCDINIHPLLELIPHDSESIDVKTFLQHRIVEMLLARIDNGASTILLDIKKMKGKPAEVLIPHIKKIRRKEIQNVSVYLDAREILCYDVFMKETDRKLIPKQNQSVNLETLWLTAYGYQVLRKCRVGLHTDIEGLRKIERALSKIDAPLKLDIYGECKDSYKTSISKSMREFILSKII